MAECTVWDSQGRCCPQGAAKMCVLSISTAVLSFSHWMSTEFPGNKRSGAGIDHCLGTVPAEGNAQLTLHHAGTELQAVGLQQWQ